MYMKVAGDIFNCKNLCTTIIIIIILALFRFNIVGQVNSDLKQLQSRLQVDTHEKVAKYKHLEDEIQELKTLIKDDLHNLNIAPNIDEKLSNSSKAIKESLHDLEDNIKQFVMQKGAKSSDKHDGSSPPFKKYQSYRLIWFATVRNNYVNAPPPNDMGGAGFAAEALGFIIPLCKKYPLFGWVEEVDTAAWKESFLFQELSLYEQHLVEKCNERGKELLEMDNIPGIGVIEYMPYDFQKIRNHFGEHVGKMKYVIGRSMFETNNIPPGWQDLINQHVNEMWVPTKFEVEVFKDHGVTVPVFDIGEGYDPVRFNSTNIQGDRAGLFPSCKSDDYIFIAASEYIERKGFDHLFEAYATAFTGDDKVCLAVRASGLTEFTFSNPNRLRCHKVGRLSSDAYRQFYKSGDVFVSGSHGEGWGRTNQEAMAMGLPVILPVWGGTTGYAREGVVITIKVDELEQAFPEKGDNWILGKERVNHKWAKVQVPRIRDAMKWAYNNKDKALAIGHKAEQYMKKHFTRSVIADDVLDRTDTIFNQLNE